MNSSIVPDHGRGVVTALTARGATVALVPGDPGAGQKLHTPARRRAVGQAAVRSLEWKIWYETLLSRLRSWSKPRSTQVQGKISKDEERYAIDQGKSKVKGKK